MDAQSVSGPDPLNGGAEPRPGLHKGMAKKRISKAKRARRMARNVIGAVPASKVIVPKTLRKKPKHKKTPQELDG